MCCAEFVVKYVLFFSNLVFCLAGLALLGVGIAVLVQIQGVNELLAEINVSFSHIPILIIVLGSIIFLIAFFGCCGAIQKSRCMLISYAVCMLVLAGLKIAMVVVLFQGLDDIYATVTGWLTDAFRQDNLLPTYHILENAFNCCGTSGADSYIITLRDIPPSCCPATVDVCTAALSYEGCNTVFGGFMDTFGTATIGVLLAVIAFELVAMMFACFLSSASKKSYV